MTNSNSVLRPVREVIVSSHPTPPFDPLTISWWRLDHPVIPQFPVSAIPSPKAPADQIVPFSFDCVTNYSLHYLLIPPRNIVNSECITYARLDWQVIFSLIKTNSPVFCDRYSISPGDPLAVFIVPLRKFDFSPRLPSQLQPGLGKHFLALFGHRWFITFFFFFSREEVRVSLRFPAPM